MIGVCGSASRIAPTRPSIMSLGATTSAPASTWLTAVRASSSSVSSFSTSPSRSTPQCPWLVYSQRHTSVTSVRPGTSARSARSARCTIPSSSQAPEPSSSFSSGIPKRSTARTPSDASSAASRTISSTERWAIPSSPVDRADDALPGAGEERHHDVVERQPRLAHERAQRVGAPQAPQAGDGKAGHRGKGTSAGPLA